MSFCERMIGSGASSSLSVSQTSPEEKLNIQNELIWGLSYRNYKENEKHRPIRPIHSPIDIPFKLCRQEMLKKKPINWENDVQEEESEGVRKETGEGKSGYSKVKTKKRKISTEKPSLLERSVWSQSKYMDFLSIPNPKFEEPKTKKYKRRCELEPCPPRFVQLAVPNKRKVFANWKEYAHFLPTEMLMRYEEILHTDQNLEPREARYYYKKLDRQRRKENKAKKLQKKRLKQEKVMNAGYWERVQIEMLAKDIVDYIKDEPLFTLNYKQLSLSDGILERLEKTSIMKKPSRKTKNHYKKTIIEVADKFAIWIDTLTRFVDVQVIESDEDIPPVSISSISGEGEGESSSEYESSSEEELRDEQLFGQEDVIWGEDGGEGDMGRSAEDLIEDIFKGGEGEDGFGIEDILNNLDEDLLAKLITILSNCSEDFLNDEINDEQMPGVRYIDVLNKLKVLQKGLEEADGKSFLEQVLIDWAVKNDPDKVDDALLKKIHQVAGCLGDWLFSGKGDDGEVATKHPPDGGEGLDSEGEDKDGQGVEGAEDEGGKGADENEGEDVGQGVKDEGEELDENAEAGEDAKVAEDEEADTSAKVGEDEEADKGPKAGEDAEGMEAGKDAKAGVEADEGAKVGEDAEDEGTKMGEGAEDGSVDVGAGTEGGEVVDTAVGSELNMEEELKKMAMDGEGEAGSSESFAETVLDGDFTTGEMTPGDTLTNLEGEEDIGYLPEVDEDEPYVEEGEDGPTWYEPGVKKQPKKEEEERLEGRIIKGHKPSKVFEHSPDTVCCLSLKTWAVWLLEITHNAHNWTQWMSCVIQKVREYASIVRGDVKLPSGQPKVLHKSEWRAFIKETEENVVAWRQYSAHVKDLSQSIVENFHDKEVNCCPKCLQDHLIKNVVIAHDTLQALTEAISCAAYWQRCLDNLVEKTCDLTQTKKDEDVEEDATSEESDGDVDLEEVKEEESGESIYEIEGIESTHTESPSKQ